MSLRPGTRLGPYEIVGAIGAGGMGEVYRARDSRLARDVAIKVLAADVAGDPGHRERFQREAHAIAALNHPHICTIHDVGHEQGMAFLVMEYVEGELLSARLAKGRLPLSQVLRYSIEIAEALQAAHRIGIVHRDLKPANVIITRSGIKLLDFGLAKLRVAPAPSTSGVNTMPPNAPLTAARTILGTLQYMAPEQIGGEEVDARTDLFAFGAVVYEMTTGRRAFDGKNEASIISAILDREPPPILASQPLTPPSLEHLVRTCLAKSPDERWQSIADVTRQLEWIAATQDEPRSPSSPRAGRRVWAGVAAGALLGGAVAFSALWFGGRRPSESRDAIRTVIDVTPADVLRSDSQDLRLGGGRPSRTAIAVSPDGRTLVFSAARGDGQQLFLRPLAQLEATPIAGTDDAHSPFISPDGQWVGFWSRGSLRKVPLAGGAPPSQICETSLLYGATWGTNDTIVYASESGGLWQVSAAGGAPRRITTPDPTKGEFSHRLPQFLPDGRTLLFTMPPSYFPNWDEARLAVLTLETGQYKELGKGADARYVSSGHLVFLRSGTLMAAPFDMATQTLTGAPSAMVGDVMQAANMVNGSADTGAGQFAVTDSGSLLFVQGGIFPDRQNTLLTADRRGTVQSLPATLRAYFAPQLSPDSSRLALWTQGLDRNVWTYDLARGTLTRLTTDGRNSRPIWTPDGKRIAYSGNTPAGVDNIFWVAADGSAPPERLTTSPNVQYPSAWTRDGRTLAFVEAVAPGNLDVLTISLDGDRQPRPLLRTRFIETYPEFSPDGRWLAYVSNESGRDEVYVQPYPGLGSRKQISTDGGVQPAWSKSGRVLFYTSLLAAGPLRMMAVSIAGGQSFDASPPQTLFEGNFQGQTLTRGYDVSADDQRFFFSQMKPRAPIRPAQMILVQNWTEELKRRVPTR